MSQRIDTSQKQNDIVLLVNQIISELGKYLEINTATGTPQLKMDIEDRDQLYVVAREFIEHLDKYKKTKNADEYLSKLQEIPTTIAGVKKIMLVDSDRRVVREASAEAAPIFAKLNQAEYKDDGEVIAALRKKCKILLKDLRQNLNEDEIKKKGTIAVQRLAKLKAAVIALDNKNKFNADAEYMLSQLADPADKATYGDKLKVANSQFRENLLAAIKAKFPIPDEIQAAACLKEANKNLHACYAAQADQQVRRLNKPTFLEKYAGRFWGGTGGASIGLLVGFGAGILLAPFTFGMSFIAAPIVGAIIGGLMGYFGGKKFVDKPTELARRLSLLSAQQVADVNVHAEAAVEPTQGMANTGVKERPVSSQLDQALVDAAMPDDVDEKPPQRLKLTGVTAVTTGQGHLQFFNPSQANRAAPKAEVLKAFAKAVFMKLFESLMVHGEGNKGQTEYLGTLFNKYKKTAHPPVAVLLNIAKEKYPSNFEAHLKAAIASILNNDIPVAYNPDGYQFNDIKCEDFAVYQNDYQLTGFSKLLDQDYFQQRPILSI